MSRSNKTPGFVPISDWPTLEQLAHGFSEHLLPQSDRLGGRHFRLTFDDGPIIDHHFIDTDRVIWRIVGGGDQEGNSDEATYRAFEVRPDIYFVDFYKVAYKEQVSFVHDVNSGQAVVCVSGFHGDNGARRTWTKFYDAHVEGQGSSHPYRPTEELIGKHILYRYTKSDAYEHVYLNQGTFTWHCLSGTEYGLADTEPCRMLKLGDELYLLFWSEKIMPVESVVVVDLKHMRSTGRFFCWDPKPNKAVHVLFGSHATLLAETKAVDLFV